MHPKLKIKKHEYVGGGRSAVFFEGIPIGSCAKLAPYTRSEFIVDLWQFLPTPTFARHFKLQGVYYPFLRVRDLEAMKAANINPGERHMLTVKLDFYPDLGAPDKLHFTPAAWDEFRYVGRKTEELELA